MAASQLTSGVSMELLSTHQGVEILQQVQSTVVEASPARVDAIRELLEEEVEFVEKALRDAAAEGEAPGTLAARHLVVAGGQRIRPMALLLSAACFGDIPPAARELAVVVEMVHAATLLHDDVIDDGDTRRGVPTARRLYGNAVSVLAGDLMLTHALDRTARHAVDVLPDLLVTLRRLVDGEVIQLRGRTSLDLSEATYNRILLDKTASLFGWATGAGARVAGAGAKDVEHLVAFGELLGTAFQLVDDALDYEGDGRRMGKPLLADLREGKVTLPLALTALHTPSLLADVALVRAGNDEVIEEISRKVRASGACAEVRRRASVATARARTCLSKLTPSAARELLDVVTIQLTGRGA